MFPLLAYAQDDRQCIREGNRMYRQKDYAKAEVLYRKALAKKQDNPQANYNLGCALMMQQKDSAAVAQFQKAAKIESTKMRLSKVLYGLLMYQATAYLSHICMHQISIHIISIIIMDSLSQDL